ncbi:MAG: DUF4178 domain-containing protein [Planctomycetia bacterium]|nr:DUF4178 domain-containing protein [Planctomycetia bacterium]
MSPVAVSCPSCGAPIQFAIGSGVVVVCPNCQSAVARTDRAYEDLGKVAAVVETDTPLKLGLKGAYRGKRFEILGRIQYRHESGALWNEWYASFPEEKWGWLAEAQGRLYLTFEGKVSKGTSLPTRSELQLGETFSIPGIAKFTVAEIGQAAAAAAEGEIPFRFTPGEMHDYADLAAGGGKFATFDYGETPPHVYVGQEVTLDDLGLAAAPLAEQETRRVGAAVMNCPNCSGSLELKAPDETLRVTCPYCNSLLDVSQGKLQFLMTIEGGRAKPLIPIGATGVIGTPQGAGVSYMVIGFMQRKVTIEGTSYFWQEYLLYSPGHPFRWLVDSDNHWSFVEAVSPGEVNTQGKLQVEYGGKTFKAFQAAPAEVTYVLGEFYWRVTIGEITMASDFVSPPQMLSSEVTVSGEGRGEINWSLGTYLEASEVAKAFHIKQMPQPHGIAPNQPFRHTSVLYAWPLLCGIALIVGIMLLAGSHNRMLLSKTYELKPVTAADQTQVEFEQSLDVYNRQNIRVILSSPVDNSWVYVEGDLFNEETGLTQGFSAPLEYYQGVEDGESWSEGTKEATIYLSALPTGKYTLRLEVQREHFATPSTLTVRVEQDHRHISHLVLLLLALSVPPALVLFWRWQFEKARWQNSDFGE